MHKQRYFHLTCLLCFGSLLIALTSCQKGELKLGDNFINSNSYTALIDTVSIQLSTIKADSIVTSSTANGLVGYYRHPLMGGQEAETFFALNPPDNFTWDDTGQVFDSLVMVLRSNTYSIGDTTVDVLFRVHPLSEKIEVNDDGKLYNTSTFAYREEPMGKIRFTPYPKRKEELNIRLDDSYATELIDFLNTYENHDDKLDLFKDKFKGFVVDCDTVITRSALGFILSDTASCLRLYSHIDKLEKEEITNNFSLSSESTFNRLSSPDQAVIYNQIANGKVALTEQKSNGTALLQSGSGLKIRIDFPTISSLSELKNKGHIVKAEIRLKPDMSIMQTADLPARIFISDIYIANDIWAYLSDDNSQPISCNLNLDDAYHEDTYYSFDLSNYINSRLTEQIIDPKRGLVISLPDTNTGSSFTWLAVNGQSRKNNQSELLLYYYYYDTE